MPVFFNSSSDGEDNDNENIEPELKRTYNGCYSPKGDPVKAFVDDEAVEEDDSDNDQLLFQENEDDEDIEDYEELNDLIATDYNEKSIDNDRRNELHQNWLEQQDAAGTDNLLQRLKFGMKLKDTTLLEGEDEEEDEDEEESGNEAAEDHAKTSVARMNSRKAKQMIPQMFSDKNDGYLSSDGEETERRLVKQQLLDKAVSCLIVSIKFHKQSINTLLCLGYFRTSLSLFSVPFGLFYKQLLNFMSLSRKSSVPCYPQPRMRNLAKCLVS